MANGIVTKEDLLRFVREHDVKIIHLWFTDILGMLKSFGITPHQLEEALDEGLGFDGSSVEGFARIYESDLIASPRHLDLPGPAVEGRRPGGRAG